MYKLVKQYAELARISNLPTCWTNVLTGCAIGSVAGSNPVALSPVVILAIIISMFYMGGMALNDLIDARIDRKQRPDRPIASGRISPRAALIFIATLFAIAAILLLIRFPHCIYLAVLLAAMIVLYDVTHKRFVCSVAFMASCRALIYIICAYGVFADSTKEFWVNTATASSVLALYIALVTLVARSESKQQIDNRRWFSIAMMFLVPAAFALSLPTTIYPCLIAVILLIILSKAAMFVLSEPPQVKQAVLTWLACICLLDSLFLAVLGSPVLALAAGLCFVVVTLSHGRIKGT
ncbi:MAG: UbiA family prenyltransferase [Planctomycetota bacterium]|jgi:4-hydroxybenzoate polyprenyltransferase